MNDKLKYGQYPTQESRADVIRAAPEYAIRELLAQIAELRERLEKLEKKSYGQLPLEKL